jgi:AraC-like DNA-binding protein
MALEANLSENEEAPAGEAYSMLEFTTDAVPEQDRLPLWREEFGRRLVRVDIEPVADGPVRAAATMGALLDFRSMTFEGSVMRFHRTRQMAAAGDSSIGLIVNRDAGSYLSHRGRDVTLSDGEACAVLTYEPGMIVTTKQLGLVFPRAELLSRAKTAEDAVAERIPADSDALHLLLGYLDVLPQRFRNSTSKLQRTVVAHIYDLAALAICPDRPAGENSLSATAAARLELAMAYLRRHYDFPGLTISTVAGDQNISARYLQRLIETTGSTFSEHLNELRLERAFVLLTDMRYRKKQIAEIASRSGFSDVSYFNRMFRRRFGETPRSVRGRLISGVDS